MQTDNDFQSQNLPKCLSSRQFLLVFTPGLVGQGHFLLVDGCLAIRTHWCVISFACSVSTNPICSEFLGQLLACAAARAVRASQIFDDLFHDPLAHGTALFSALEPPPSITKTRLGDNSQTHVDLYVE